MKTLNFLFATVLISIAVSSCGTTATEEKKDAGLNPFVIRLDPDTMNYTGTNGKKHGMWIVNGEKIIYKNDTAYTFTDSTVQDLIKKLNAK